MHNVALLLSARNSKPEAEQLMRSVLSSARCRLLGPEHADTLLEANNLAGVLHSRGKLDEAETLYRGNLEVLLRVLGPEHRWTLNATNGLARILEGRGRLDEAEKMYRSDLEVSRRIRGLEHIDTLTEMNNLAHVLQARGKLAEAERLFRDSLEARRRRRWRPAPLERSSPRIIWPRCCGPAEGRQRPINCTLRTWS